MTNKGLHKMKMRKASPVPRRLMKQILKNAEVFALKMSNCRLLVIFGQTKMKGNTADANGAF